MEGLYHVTFTMIELRCISSLRTMSQSDAFLGQTKTSPQNNNVRATNEAERDLGHHSGGCWFGHRPDCTCGPKKAAHRESTKPRCPVQILHSATAMLKNSPQFFSEKQFFIPAPSFGSIASFGYGEPTVNNISLLKNLNMKLSRDMLICYC